MTPTLLGASIKKLARDVGFDLVGIAPAHPSAHTDYFRQWLDQGRHGQMQYLADRFDERVDPGVYLKGARSVVCVAMNYAMPVEDHSALRDPVKIARYARSLDYHEHVKPRLYKIADFIRDAVPGAQTRCGVDTAPILERELAARAGVGWVGKNTCVIHPRIGSWILLGEVLTTLELPYDEPAVDRCGTCRRCIDACPTDAIFEPYKLDASRCISYLTIEHLDEIKPELQEKLSGWLFGCDICQEVCPYNRKSPIAELEELRPRVPHAIERQEVQGWDQQAYWDFTRRTPMRRISLEQFKRNAEGNG